MDIFETKETGLSINLGRLSKETVAVMAQSIVENVLQGNEYALEQYVKAKGLAEIANSIVDGLKDMAIRDAANYTTEDKVLGCTVQVKSTATTYDFSHNTEWAMLNAHLEATKKKMKYIESQMVEALNHEQMVDMDGVIIEPAKIKKPGGTTIAVNMPKE
jgi:hypothetical protein